MINNNATKRSRSYLLKHFYNDLNCVGRKKILGSRNCPFCLAKFQKHTVTERRRKEKKKRERERYAAVANSVKGRKRWEKSGRRSARFQLGCANVEDSRVQKQLLKIVILLSNEQVRLRIFFIIQLSIEPFLPQSFYAEV